MSILQILNNAEIWVFRSALQLIKSTTYMTNLNRKEQPKFQKIEKIDIIKTESLKLDNGIPIHFINAGSEDILKIDIIYDAGIWHQEQPLLASFTNHLLLGGTKNNSSAQLAEEIDFYGADINTEIGYNTGSIKIYTLGKYLEKIIKIASDITENSIFPEDELKTAIENKKQEFIISNQKVEKIANRKFKGAIFGTNHPYGTSAELSDFDKLNTEIIKDFYEKYYTANTCKIIVSGKIKPEYKQIINKYLGKRKFQKIDELVIKEYKITPQKEQKIYIEKKNAVQSAIRIGARMINRKHHDFIDMQIVNTILGGFFGSRLMKNIREDKGYTYGIGSGIVSLINSGYLIISTEAGKKVKDLTLKEIYYEIEKMKSEEISFNELELVRNQMMGQLQRGLNGPFALSHAFRQLMLYKQDYSYYDKILDRIKNITSKEILELSNKYFDTDKFYEVVVG